LLVTYVLTYLVVTYFITDSLLVLCKREALFIYFFTGFLWNCNWCQIINFSGIKSFDMKPSSEQKQLVIVIDRNTKLLISCCMNLVILPPPLPLLVMWNLF